MDQNLSVRRPQIPTQGTNARSQGPSLLKLIQLLKNTVEEMGPIRPDTEKRVESVPLTRPDRVWGKAIHFLSSPPTQHRLSSRVQNSTATSVCCLKILLPSTRNHLNNPNTIKMHSQTLLLSLAGVAAANLAGHHMAVRRELEARQTDDSFSACAEAMMSLVTDMPTPPAALTELSVTDPCSVTIPPSLESAYSSYMSEVSSWNAEHADEYSSALALCPDLPTITDSGDIAECTDSAGNSGSPTAGSSSDSDSGDAEETDSGSTSGSGSATRTGSGASAGATSTSGSSSGSGSGSSGSSNNNNNNNSNGGSSGKPSAAHRETGFVGAAVALAGFIGVVALL
ncbi:hypothetical protein N657DRAFT_631876 [Parathielavia appendiculata]|uniref:Uncharacterized protein n=1 Tax=Parathielavia appendiculata TaxID=2587402 RepID=A0AAN6U3G4_9PEZI|nr:hypothetical protein N657DRAFT_631876 [Parathielavia appendiculata]